MITFKNIGDNDSIFMAFLVGVGIMLLTVTIVLLSIQFIAWETPSNELLRFSLIPITLLIIAGRVNYLEQRINNV